jgi:Conserved protein/domain typically associated with flavoprotein oxygenases, DIM6/NTAB family
MAAFKEIKPEEFTISPFRLIGKDWMLIAAEKDGRCNAMTASWGGLGVMWGKNVAFAVIRPQRFTKEFVDDADEFTLNFLGPEHRKTLDYMGTASGRDEDKIAKTGLTVEHAGSAPYFAESAAALVCRKLFAQPYRPECFIDASLDRQWYPDKDYHTLYVAEVTKVLVKPGSL